jgi:hypothetical protein
MTPNQLAELFDAAVRDVETARQRNCGTSDECRVMVGCVKCAGVFSGAVGIECVEVFPGSDGFGVIRVTTTGDHKSPMPCTLSFRIPMTVHGSR